MCCIAVALVHSRLLWSPIVCTEVQRLPNYLLNGSETVKSAAHIRNIYSLPWDDKTHNKSVGVSITMQLLFWRYLFVLHNSFITHWLVSKCLQTSECLPCRLQVTVAICQQTKQLQHAFFCVAPSLQLISLRNSQHPLLSEEYTFFPSDLSFLGLLGLACL